MYIIKYTEVRFMAIKFPKPGEGPGTVASSEDLIRDANGHTNPNLHRRIDPQEPSDEANKLNQESAPRGYEFSIEHTYSYRTTTINTHDEDSEAYIEDPETGKIITEIP